ncbi:hypothetical protein K160097B7_35420 [[Clostridium] hylemonae]|uniref:leucine-rich repeat protein n=3 Tax=[Clostridium] hylemonae TaxID=89153 RepID=UPI0036F441F6
MMKCKERILALLLTSAMLLGMTAPVTAKAEAQAVPLERQIQSFSALTDGSVEKEVPQGTTWEELKLPGELEAMVLRQGDGAETGGESTVSAPVKENVPVTWESRPAYDGETPGDYILTAAPGEGYTAPEEGSAPRITVRVKAVQTNAAQTNAGLKSAPTSQPPSTGTTFTVEVNGNGPGAVKNAVEAAPGINDKERYTTITLTGDATELTGDNWDYLRSLYNTNSDWTNLTTLDLSEMDGLIKVAGSASNNIGRLTTVIFPDKLKTIGSNAFWDGGSLKNAVFPDGLRSIEDGAFWNCRILTGVAFPNSLQTIGTRAFYSCIGLTEVTFPKNLETVGDFAFSECDSMESFTVADGNGYFSSENGVLYDKKMETLLIYPIGNTDTSFAVPDGVRTIKKSAFYNCLSLTKVIFPDSLETIEFTAFSDCRSLASLTFAGDRPPNAVAPDALNSIASSGTIYYPAGKESNYNDTWKSGLSGSVGSDYWTLVPGYRLTVAGGTDTTKGGLYQENDSVSLTAAPSAGRQFDRWTSSGGGAFANAEEPSTTFTMPAAHVMVTAHFTPSYSERTLRDPSTGVTVRGSFTEDAVLNVKPGTLHTGDDDPACDAIRAYGKDNGSPLLLYDISLSAGETQGEVDVMIPVGAGYNGRTATVMHCHRRELERIKVPVENGAVTGTFGGLSPFAVFVPGGGRGSSPSTGSGVQTGDPLDPIAAVLVMLASLTVCASVLLYRKRCHRK